VARRPPGPLPLNTGTANSPARTQTAITAAVIALVLIAVVALAVLSFTVHLLFSPWLLVAIAVLAWIRFRPRRSRR
jgi:ABC-type Na+ efflux pump permease subunit